MLRSARKSRVERIGNEYIKGILQVKGKPDLIDIIEQKKTAMVWPRQKDGRGENAEINCGLDTTGEEEKRTTKINVDGRSTSSHDNRKFRNRSMEKQRGMAFGFRQTATAVEKNWTDR